VTRPPTPQDGTLDRSFFEPEFADDFEGPALDGAKWLPVYLPHWSGRDAARARYRFEGGGLTLTIEPDQPAWLPDRTGEMRVSNLQTGAFAGPLGSEIGQHRFGPGLTVVEAQEERALYTPSSGLVEARAAMTLPPGSMAALWLIGFERRPEESAEVTVFEIFGDEVDEDRALVGMGVHPFGDPRLSDTFRKVPVAIDVREPHTYAAAWHGDGAWFFVDDRLVAAVDTAPDYAMQLMLDVFEFGVPHPPAPRLLVERVAGYRWTAPA
jgi:Glycosyl hydrolases family 16